MRALLLVMLAAGFCAAATHAKAAFECRMGGRAACLDYGDKVCSSMAKCVDRSALCFDSYTCNYKGFVCKSKMDDVAQEYDNLLVKAKRIATDYDALRDCLQYATTLEDAKSCPN